jgi:hypothetical protein
LLTVTIGSGKTAVVAHGAVVLNANMGGGYFLTKTNGGAVTLQP